MAHCMFHLFAKSVAFVADEGDDHAVQVEEEHQEVEAQLDERFLELAHGRVSYRAHSRRARKPMITNLLVHIQLAENLGRIQQVLVVVDPIVPEKNILRLAFAAGTGECGGRHGRRVAGRTSSH